MVLSVDRVSATTAYADIVGLSFPVVANARYWVDCALPYSANATTTGIGVSWTGPAAPILTSARMISGLTTQTIGGTTIAGNDTGAATTASVATTGNVALFTGIWSNGSSPGSVQLRFKSEVAAVNAVTIKAGAVCRVAVY